MRKWETSDFPLQSLFPPSSPPPFLSLVQSWISFFTFSQHIQDISKPNPKSPLLPDEVSQLINSLFFASAQLIFGGEGGRGWVSYITPWIWLYMHGNTLRVLISQGRFLFINEEEEGGHTNTLRWWRERSITIKARCYPWADVRSNKLLFCFFRRTCLDICLK